MIIILDDFDGLGKSLSLPSIILHFHTFTTLLAFRNYTLTNTLVIGVDIAKTIHYARAFDYRGVELAKVFKFENSREGLESFKEWIDSSAKETGKSGSIVGMEPTGHNWLNLGHFLRNEGMRLVLVNPFHVKRSKELDDNAPTKNDRR